jgi:hypothetical protein
MAEVFSRCDMSLPSHMAISVRHFISHMFLPIRRNGTVLTKGACGAFTLYISLAHINTHSGN